MFCSLLVFRSSFVFWFCVGVLVLVGVCVLVLVCVGVCVLVL